MCITDIIPYRRIIPRRNRITLYSKDMEMCEKGIIEGTQESYLDCPTREKGAFLGDGLVIRSCSSCLYKRYENNEKNRFMTVCTPQGCARLFCNGYLRCIADNRLFSCFSGHAEQVF